MVFKTRRLAKTFWCFPYTGTNRSESPGIPLISFFAFHPWGWCLRFYFQIVLHPDIGSEDSSCICWFLNNWILTLHQWIWKHVSGTSGGPQVLEEVHEMKIIFPIIRLCLLFLLSSSQECTVELSRGRALCGSIIALVASVFRDVRFFSKSLFSYKINTHDIKHNKTFSESLIKFKSKGFLSPKCWSITTLDCYHVSLEWNCHAKY